MSMTGRGMAGELPRGPEKLGRIVHRLEWRWGLGKCGVGGDLIGDALASGTMILLHASGENIVALKCRAARRYIIVEKQSGRWCVRLPFCPIVVRLAGRRG